MHFLVIHCLFVQLIQENRFDYYRSEDCMKNHSKVLKEYVTEIINYEKKEMISLTYEESESLKMQKVCYICKKKLIQIKKTNMHLNYTIN